MNKVYFTLLLLFLKGTFGFTQNALELITKLKTELKTNPDDKRKATIYSDIAWYYVNVSTDSALVYSKKAMNESTKLNDSVLIAQVNSDLGAIYFRRNDFENAKKYYGFALNIRKARKDNVGIAKINLHMANIYNKENKKEKALQYYLAGIDYFEKTNNPEIVANTKGNVAALFFELKNYPKAKKYLNDAIKYQETKKDDNGLSTSYLTLGNIYLKTNDTLNALKLYEKSIASAKKSANNVALSSAMNNLGVIKSEQKKSSEAQTLFANSKAVKDSLSVKKDASISDLSIAKEHIMYQRFDQANKVLYQLKERYQNNPSEQELLLSTYQFFIHTYAYLHQPDSVNYYNNLATNIQSKIVETAIAKQTNELETKYQTAKKEKQLLLKEIEIKQTRDRLFLVIGIALIIALIGWLIYRQQKIRNKQQQQEFELKSAIAKIETQNKLQEQRLQISRDLHDNIGSQLTFIISSVDNVKYAFNINNDKLDNKLSGISNFARETIIELRDTIWAMNKSQITLEDLESRIHNFVEKAKIVKTEIAFTFKVDERLIDIQFSSVEGMNIYRAIQEAINNSIKYANATAISIDMFKENDTIKVTINDNGIGFSSDEVNLGNGIVNMQKRIKDIGGTFEMNAQKGIGTTIIFKVPMP
ncbi:sensor histidine kinase [Flavobacterium sp.]|uniref:sensor histidine kinase n=1 Tax=Flavobacterium sp. TaxID=239 RepID=UPI002C1ADAB9|nr:sensor histidine kinase [Flavobacterium sp.]HQA74289.1 sensor histidine kinase [Flavobacterium sp.]